MSLFEVLATAFAVLYRHHSPRLCVSLDGECWVVTLSADGLTIPAEHRSRELEFALRLAAIAVGRASVRRFEPAFQALRVAIGGGL